MSRAPAAVLTACLLAYLVRANHSRAAAGRGGAKPNRSARSSMGSRPGASARRTWAGGSSISRSSRATRTRSTSPRPAAASGRPPTAAPPSRRSSTTSRRSAPARSRSARAKPEVVYVGTGEGNPRNSVSWGNGVYKSADGGKTWTHCGLADTHHIGRVVVHPKNPDIAYVAALGHFWGPNNERGLYKTTDGGKTWEKSKFIDADTGFVDVQMDPDDPDTLYAAAWQVRRDAFSGGSPRTQIGR